MNFSPPFHFCLKLHFSPPHSPYFCLFFSNSHLIVYSRDSQEVFGGKNNHPSLHLVNTYTLSALSQLSVQSHLSPTWARRGLRGKEVRLGSETANMKSPHWMWVADSAPSQGIACVKARTEACRNEPGMFGRKSRCLDPYAIYRVKNQMGIPRRLSW